MHQVLASVGADVRRPEHTLRFHLPRVVGEVVGKYDQRIVIGHQASAPGFAGYRAEQFRKALRSHRLSELRHNFEVSWIGTTLNDSQLGWKRSLVDLVRDET